jgi:hypothetical protein
MYRIGIIGHGPEVFSDDEYQAVVKRIIVLLSNQYSEDLIFNIGSEIGVEHIAMEQCLKHNCHYHLFLPAQLDNVGKFWYERQQIDLRKYFEKARGVTISMKEMTSEAEKENYKQLIDHSNFLVCFWIGKKQGRTADAIRYALSTNKLTLNGLNDLRLITNYDFTKRKIK